MAEYLTEVWVRIDNFSYSKKIDRIDYEDIALLKKTTYNFIRVPGLILFINILLSRNRLKLWNLSKEWLMKNNKNIVKEKVKQREVKQVSQEEIDKMKTPIIFTQIKLTSATKEQTGRKKFEEEIMNLPRQELGTFTEFSKNNKDTHSLLKKSVNVKFFKGRLNKNTLHRAESYMLKTKLIYIPFIIIFVSFFYDLVVNYLALYIKYKPLVDEYSKRTIEKNKN